MDEITIRFPGMKIRARGVSPAALLIVSAVVGVCVTAGFAIM